MIMEPSGEGLNKQQGLIAALGSRVRKRVPPRVMLVIEHRFRGAALVTLLQRAGCDVVWCRSGREAYVRYLRRHSDEFDLAVVDWDLSDVGGRDLLYYEREKGGSLVFVAVVPQWGNASDVLRSGADLYLRRPLAARMHLLRGLLLPKAQSQAGYPGELMRRIAAVTDVRRMLEQLLIHPDPDVDAAVQAAIADLEALPETAMDTSLSIVQHLVVSLKNRLATEKLEPPHRRAADPAVLRGDGEQGPAPDKDTQAMADFLATFSEMRAELVALQNERRELRLLVTETSPTASVTAVVGDVDRLSRPAALVALKNCRNSVHRLQIENDTLRGDLHRLSHYKMTIEKALESGGIQVRVTEQAAPSPPPLEGREPASPLAAVRSQRRAADLTSMSPSQLRTIALQRSRGKTQVETPLQRLTRLNRALEESLMEAEDHYLRRSLGSVSPLPRGASTLSGTVAGLSVSFPIQVTSQEESPIDSAYNAVASLLHAFVDATNEFAARLVATHPFLRAKCDGYVNSTLSPLLRSVDLVALFEKVRRWHKERRQAVVDALNAERMAHAAAQQRLRQQQSAVELTVKLQRFNAKVANALRMSLDMSLARRVWERWLGLMHSRRAANVSFGASNAADNGILASPLALEKTSTLQLARRELLAAQRQLDAEKVAHQEVQAAKAAAENIAEDLRRSLAEHQAAKEKTTKELGAAKLQLSQLNSELATLRAAQAKTGADETEEPTAVTVGGTVINTPTAPVRRKKSTTGQRGPKKTVPVSNRLGEIRPFDERRRVDTADEAPRRVPRNDAADLGPTQATLAAFTCSDAEEVVRPSPPSHTLPPARLAPRRVSEKLSISPFPSHDHTPAMEVLNHDHSPAMEGHNHDHTPAAEGHNHDHTPATEVHCQPSVARATKAPIPKRRQNAAGVVSARLLAHAERMRAARLGLRQVTTANKQPSESFRARSKSPPAAGAESNEGPATIIASLHHAAGVLRSLCGVNLNVDSLPSAASEPDAAHVLRVLMHALTTAADVALASRRQMHRRISRAKDGNGVAGSVTSRRSTLQRESDLCILPPLLSPRRPGTLSR